MEITLLFTMIHVIITTGTINAAIYWQHNRLLLGIYFNEGQLIDVWSYVLHIGSVLNFHNCIIFFIFKWSLAFMLPCITFDCKEKKTLNMINCLSVHVNFIHIELLIIAPAFTENLHCRFRAIRSNPETVMTTKISLRWHEEGKKGIHCVLSDTWRNH